MNIFFIIFASTIYKVFLGFFVTRQQREFMLTTLKQLKVGEEKGHSYPMSEKTCWICAHLGLFGGDTP
jgi:hypothetical protein